MGDQPSTAVACLLRIPDILDPCSRAAAGKNNPGEAKKPGASSTRRKKAPPAAQRTQAPLPPPTRPDEQLYWLDLTVDRKWDLRLNRPFDRAVGSEVASSMLILKVNVSYV